MSTIQIVGIAAAAVIVLLLIIALVVTRKSGEDEAGGTREAEAGGSFLDSAPSDTLAKLGRPEHVPEPADADAGETPPAGVVMTATGVASAPGGGLGLDWDHGEKGAAPPAPPVPDETETTGEIPAVAAEAEAAGPEMVETEIAEPAAAEEPPTESQPAATPETSDSLVPLSSIIVTTSTKMVDLNDPEIRRMLTDLVAFEMDQATQFREQGQTIDAVLQLTEAEKICTALGKLDMAREIRDMMRGLKA